MTTNVQSPSFYADPSGLAALKKGAGDQDPKALREAARQFESLFTQMMLKSMRDANRSFRSQDSFTDSEQTDFYREMFDNQMALQLSKGKGLGLADLLVKQLHGGASVAAESKQVTRDSGLGTRQRAAPDTVEAAPLIRSDAPAPKSIAGSNPEDFCPPFNLPLTLVTDSTPNKLSTEAMLKEFISLFDVPDSSRASLPSAVNGREQNRIDPSTPALRKTGTGSLASPESRVPSHRGSVDTAAPRPLATSPSEFVSQLWPHAEAVGRELGVDPRTLIAHAALETGWGKSVPCNPDGTCSFNLFGVKASGRWHGASVGVSTIEYEDGIAVQKRASFRAYDSPADSFRDYAMLIKNSPRYAAALGSGKDAAAFGNALQQGGYATDPNYANKLAAVADRLGATLKTAAKAPLASGRSVSSGGET